MRLILTGAASLLLLCCQPVTAQEQQQQQQEQQQVSKDFTKTYRAYNAAYTQRNYPRAAELARKVLDLAIEELGADHEKISVLQVNLAHVLIITGKIEEAEPILLKAKADLIKRFGPDETDLITVHEDHAKIYASRKELEKARQELDEIISIITRKFSDKDPAIADILVQQATLDIAGKKLDEGEAVYRQALAIYIENFGQDSIRSADVISFIGDINLARKDYEKAEEDYTEALRIYKDNLLEDDPVVLANHSRLAKLYVALRDDKFIPHADKVIKYTPDKDGAALPLFVMRPKYPIFQDGVRPIGWALVEFTVTTDGRVLEPKIIESKPGKIFDKVSLDVAPTWRFKPKIVEGERVNQERTRVRLVYTKDNIEVYFGELKL